MEKGSNYPFSIVDEFNEGLKLLNKELQIVRHEGTNSYCIDILDIDENGETKGITTFADNLSEDELLNFAIEANYSIFNDDGDDDEEIDKDDLITFKIVRDDTNVIPSLIYALTSIDLFFHDFDTDGIEKVTTDSIDDYADRNGEFCVHKDDYEVAQQQINERS